MSSRPSFSVALGQCAGIPALSRAGLLLLLSYGHEDSEARWLEFQWSTALARLLPTAALATQGADGSLAG